MRIGRILTITALGAALSMGALTVPAQAHSSSATAATTQSAATSDRPSSVATPMTAYYFWASYTSLADCTVAGYKVIQSNPSRYLKAKCSYGSNGKYNLYILI